MMKGTKVLASFPGSPPCARNDCVTFELARLIKCKPSAQMLAHCTWPVAWVRCNIDIIHVAAIISMVVIIIINTHAHR